MKPAIRGRSLKKTDNNATNKDIQLISFLKQMAVCESADQEDIQEWIENNGKEVTEDDIVKTSYDVIEDNKPTDLLIMRMRVAGTRKIKDVYKRQAQSSKPVI